MRVSAHVVLIGVLSALFGWMIRGVQMDRGMESKPVVIVEAAPKGQSMQPPSGIVRPSRAVTDRVGRRDPFTYVQVEWTGPPVVTIAPIPPRPVTVPSVTPAPIAEEKPPLQFPYRYIGVFGPDVDPIAAFARDGSVVTVRAGERIDSQFALRSIGLESVTVESIVAGRTDSVRVGLGAATTTFSR